MKLTNQTVSTKEVFGHGTDVTRKALSMTVVARRSQCLLLLFYEKCRCENITATANPNLVKQGEEDDEPKQNVCRQSGKVRVT